MEKRTRHGGRKKEIDLGGKEGGRERGREGEKRTDRCREERSSAVVH